MPRLLGLTVLLLTLPAFAQEVSSVRQSQYEWQCETSDGLLVSGHTRQDKAFQSCYNKALETGDEYIVRGGRFKVTAVNNGTTADSAMLKWANPTKNVDGTPIDTLQAIEIYRVEPQPRLTVASIDPKSVEYEVTGLVAGQEYCWVAKAKANDELSKDSNRACITL